MPAPKYSINEFTADGVRVSWAFNFTGGPALELDHVKLSVTVGDAEPTYPTKTFSGTSTIIVSPAIVAGATVRIFRETPKISPLADFSNGSVLNEANLDRNAKQAVYLAQEAVDNGNITLEDLVLGDADILLAQREVYLDECYATEASTDNDALDYFFANFATYGDCVLKLRPGKGRGPSGVYEVIRLTEYTSTSRIVIDGQFAIMRFTDSASQIKYSPTQQSSANYRFNYFAVENLHVQTADDAVTPFFWNMPYRDSLVLGSGHAKNIRFHSQTRASATQTFAACFKTKNTWSMSIRDCLAVNQDLAGSTFLEQDGLCVVAALDHIETTGFDTVIEPGYAAMVGINGSFGSGTYARGKVLQQGAVTGYFGRDDGAYGYTYSLYDAVGTFVPGVCDVLDSVGAVVGAFTISSTGTYSQISEGYNIGGGSTFVNCDYFMNFAVPVDATARVLDVTFSDMHCAPMEGFILADGIAQINIGSGVNLAPKAAGKTMIDIANADAVTINGVQSTTNALGGTFCKLRGIIGGSFSDNDLAYYTVPLDTDNTVKDFSVAGNTGYTTGVLVNTGKRYNAVNTRGIRFYNNGAMGVGVDMDDNRRRVWTPVVSCEGGSLTTVAVTKAYFTVCGPVIHYTCKVTVTARGTASGRMYLSLPEIVTAVGETGVKEHMGRGLVGNNSPCAVIWAEGTPPRLEVQGPASNTTNDAFKQADVAGNYVYYISGSAPVEYD
jgi:hypothetical protein